MANTTLSYGGRTLALRIDPNNITWAYALSTKVDDTVGGKVVQILGMNIDNLTLDGECGVAGRAELRRIATFVRDFALWQRQSGKPGRLTYVPRNYVFGVYVSSFTYNDATENVAFPYTIVMKVQEDLSGVASSKTIRAELARLQAGIGYTKNAYTVPAADIPSVPNTNNGEVVKPGGPNVAF